MANVPHDSVTTGSGVEEKGHGAEHTGFLHKLKEKLHIGQKHEEKVAASGEAPARGTASDATPVVSKSSTDEHVSGTPVGKPVGDVAAAPPPATSKSAVAPEEHGHHDVRPPSDKSSVAGHESEHHGGVPTFLTTLPDRDIPAEDAQAHPELHVTPKGDSKQAQHYGEQHGVVPEGGVPTFLAALPEQDIPAEDAPAHRELHHSGDTSHVESKDAHQGGHHGVTPEGSVPTFLATLPGQDIPAEDAPAHPELHHGHQEPHGAPRLDSEQVFEQAQQGEHHHGVPTFLVALPDEEIPTEVTKGVESTHDAPPADNPTPEDSQTK